jgi:sporulation protein YlmC with PRC-barrel domain
MKSATGFVLSFSLLAFAGAAAAAGDTQDQRGNEPPRAQQPTQRQADMPWDRGAATPAALARGEILTSNLRGMQVVNAQGEDIGDVSDIVLDLNSGKVHAAVLEFGGFLGIGEKRFAFPISELKPGKERNQVVMNIDKQALESREGFSTSRWPGMDDAYWSRVGGKRTDAAAAAGSGGEAQKMNLVRASELTGKEVQDKNGQNVGQVRDLVVGLEQGELKNIVVAVRDGGQASVPGKAIKAAGTGDTLVLDMSAEELRSRAQREQPQRGSGGTLRPSDRPLQPPATQTR